MSRSPSLLRNVFFPDDAEAVELRLSELASVSGRIVIQALMLMAIVTMLNLRQMSGTLIGVCVSIAVVVIASRTWLIARLEDLIDEHDLERMRRAELGIAFLTLCMGINNAAMIVLPSSGGPVHDAVLCTVGLIAPLGALRTLGFSPLTYTALLVPMLAASTTLLATRVEVEGIAMVWIAFGITIALITEVSWRFMVANRDADFAAAQARRLADRQWSLFDASPLAIALTRAGRLERGNAKLQAWFAPDASTAAAGSKPAAGSRSTAAGAPPRDGALGTADALRRGRRLGKGVGGKSGRERLQAALRADSQASAAPMQVPASQLLDGIAARTGRSRERLQRLVSRAEARVHGHRSVELRIPLRDGLPSYVGLQIRRFDPLRPDEGLVWSMSDRTAEWQNRQALERAALHDPLTGALNRRGLIGRLEALLQRKLDERPLAVLCLDMNGFKPLNDRHGHAFGDHVLRAITERLKHTLRGTDLVARPGGDEFIIVLDPVQSRAEAVGVAERISEVISSPLVIEGLACRVQAAIGMASAPEDGATVDALIAVADREMYAVKRAISPGLVPPAERTPQDRRSPR